MLSHLVRKLSRIPIDEVLGTTYASGSWQPTRDGGKGGKADIALPPVNLWPCLVVKCGEGQQCQNFFIDPASPGPVC